MIGEQISECMWVCPRTCHQYRSDIIVLPGPIKKQANYLLFLFILYNFLFLA
jgi:hypothetical protein